MKRIEAALNTQLIANANSIAIEVENTNYKPVKGTPYMRATLVPAKPLEWNIGASKNKHTGIYQVALIFPLGEGVKAINAQADIIVAAFKQATTLTYSAIDVYIKSAGRKKATAEKDWYYMPIDIEYKCYLPN